MTATQQGEDGDSCRVWQLLLDASRETAGNNGEVDPPAAGDPPARADLGPSARCLLDALAPIATARRIVVAQLGQSLDGRIATRTGHSHYINGPVALTHLHRLRALVDAVVIGAGTACADEPRLTVRHVEGSDPVRVIIDPKGRVPALGPLFQDGGTPAAVIHLIGTDADPEAAPAHVERIRLDQRADGFAPADILAALHNLGLNRVLIEGGADTVSRFLDAGALDRLHLLIAPLVIGSGRNGLDLPPIDRLEQARRPRIRSFGLGDELLVDVDLRRDAAVNNHQSQPAANGVRT